MILREFVETDVEHLFELDSDPEVTKYINGGKPTPRKHIEEKVMPHILNYYENDDGLGIWAAMNQTSGSFMGWFLLRPNRADESEIELGYRLKREFWGHGYATEGSEALVTKGFNELKVSTIIAIADPENGASQRVMQKVGLKYEKQYAEPDGFIVVKYRLDRETYTE